MVSSKMYPGPTSQKDLGRRTSHKDGGNYSCSIIPYLDRRGNYVFRVSNMTLFFISGGTAAQRGAGSPHS